MGRIALDDIKPGMVLGEDAIAGGNTLLPGGVELTAKHIEIFQSWGIKDLEIEGISNADLKADEMKVIDSAKLKQAESEIAPVFRLNNIEQPFIAELFRLSTLYKVNGEN